MEINKLSALLNFGASLLIVLLNYSQDEPNNINLIFGAISFIVGCIFLFIKD